MNHNVKNKIKPLTIAELRQLNGHTVWVNGLMRGFERIADEFGGWHTVDTTEDKLVKNGGKTYYEIADMNDPYGFRAYLTKPTDDQLDEVDEIDEDDIRYVATPKGLAFLSLKDVGLVNDIDDSRIDAFWILFEHRMEQAGYLVDE